MGRSVQVCGPGQPYVARRLGKSASRRDQRRHGPATSDHLSRLANEYHAARPRCRITCCGTPASRSSNWTRAVSNASRRNGLAFVHTVARQVRHRYGHARAEHRNHAQTRRSQHPQLLVDRDQIEPPGQLIDVLRQVGGIGRVDPRSVATQIRDLLRRAAAGGASRDEYLDQLAESIERQKPWLAEGISRATWYRRRKSE
jgi:hypothetical protein